MLISVITVCYNAEKRINDTIRSVLNQDFCDYEYIIKDGRSSDRTLEIAEKYKSEFENKNIDYRIISSKDSGIYDAMNECLKYVNGEWIIFINAGDKLYDEKVLSDASLEFCSGINVLYGDTLLIDKIYSRVLKARKPIDFKYLNPICHQSAFLRADTAKKIGFDCDYLIAADFDFFLKALKENRDCFKYFERIVSTYLLGGISGRRLLKREIEFNRSRKYNHIKRVRFPFLLMICMCLVDCCIRIKMHLFRQVQI